MRTAYIVSFGLAVGLSTGACSGDYAGPSPGSGGASGGHSGGSASVAGSAGAAGSAGQGGSGVSGTLGTPCGSPCSGTFCMGTRNPPQCLDTDLAQPCVGTNAGMYCSRSCTLDDQCSNPLTPMRCLTQCANYPETAGRCWATSSADFLEQQVCS